MASRFLQQLKKKAQQLRAEADRIDAIVAVAEEDPNTALHIESIAADPLSSGAPDPMRVLLARQTDQLPIQRIRTYFISCGNKPQSIRQIADGTGLTRNRVNWVLYYKYAPCFLVTALGETETRKLWRLTDQALDTENVGELPRGEEPPSTHRKRPRIEQIKKKPIPKRGQKPRPAGISDSEWERMQAHLQ